MPLQKQPLNINFALGLDQKTDPLQVKPGRFLSLKNRVFNKLGRLEKRNGYDAKAQSVITPPGSFTFSQIPGSVAVGRNDASFQNELTLNDGLNFYSYSQTADNWIYKGRVELCRTAETSIFKNQYENLMPDSALNSTLGVNVYAWESWTASPYQIAASAPLSAALNGVQISVVDAGTGQNIFTTTLANTTSRPKCVSISNKLYVLYFNSGDNKLYAQPVTQSGLGVASAIITNIDSTTPNYDVIVVGSNFYVGYNGSGSTVKVASFDSSLNPVANVSKAEVASDGVGLFSDTSNNIWVAYNNGSATKAFIMNSALAVTVLAPTTVDSGAGASGVKNVTGVYDGTRGIIYYDKIGGPIAGQDTGYTISASFVQPAVGATVNPTISGGGGSFASFFENNSIIYIPTGGYYFITGAIVGSASATLANLGLSGNATPGATVASSAQIIYPTAGWQNSIVTYNTLTAGGVAGTAAVLMRSSYLAGKAFLVNSVPHVITGFDSTLQSTYFACALYNVNSLSSSPKGVVVAKIAESAGGGPPYRSVLPAVNTSATNQVQFAFSERSVLLLRTSNNASTATYYLGVASAAIDFTTNDILNQDLGKNLLIGSGLMQMYDGAATCEQGFNIYPETVTAIASGADGDLGTGSYGYRVVYQWIDNFGQTHRSAPSPTLSIDTTAGNHVTLTIPTLRITEKQNVTIAIYRTLLNGAIYFRIDTQYLNYPIANTTAGDTVSFTDYSGDYSISGNEQLYTEQEVENIAPSACLFLTNYKNRAIYIPSNNPYSWGYSKQVINGSPVEFSDLFLQNMGTADGPLIGAAKLDDKLILFKANSLYYVTGTGPAASGANNDFSDPQFITADAGLLDPRSIVTIPDGLMFKSAKGIYLLDRSLQARYIGKAVEDFNTFTARGAQLIPKSNQARFILSNGQCLMYNYYWKDEEGIGQWAAFDPIDAVSDCIFQDLHTYVTASGVVYQETPGVYLDGASGISTSFKTGWFNLAGLQGFERAYYFYFLAQYLSAHTLTINLYYDYDAITVAQTLTITPNATDLEQWRVFLSQQKCQAFQIELTESGATGAGFTMSGLDLVVGLKKGYTTIKAAASAS
jgi:hypothetical protein